MDIRSLESVALNDVAVALADAFREDGDNPAGEWSALLEREISQRRVDTAASVVAIRDGRVVGACLVNRGPDETGRIGPTGTVAHARRQGVASLLVHSARERLVAGGSQRLVLEVGVENRGAQRLYESLGFQSVRPLVNLIARRSSLVCPEDMTPAKTLAWDSAVEVCKALHPTVPAFQRRAFYVASLGHGATAYGIPDEDGGWSGGALLRGRAVLDLTARSADGGVLSALLWAMTEQIWKVRIIHEVADEAVAETLQSIGCEVESNALEMAW